MIYISRDNPCYYITAVCKNRLMVFRKDEFKMLACNSLDEARRSGKILVFAYVIMLDHLHVITDGANKPAHVLRFIKGIMAHRIIKYLRENDYQISLEKLRHAELKNEYKYSLWQKESNLLSLTSESFFMQKVNYIHQNPVRAGFVERAVDYRWSSARIWAGCPIDAETLQVDIEQIAWRNK
jgi:putative transposase